MLLSSPLLSRRSAAALAVALVLAGCASAPPGATPSDQPLIGGVVPARLDGAGATASGTALPDSVPTWWQQLVQDPRLREVVALALANNRDLRLAVLNIDAARAQHRISDAARLPTVAANAATHVFSDVVHTRLLRNVHGDSSGVRGAAWLWNEP